MAEGHQVDEQTPLVGETRHRRPPHQRNRVSVASIQTIHVPKVHNSNTIVNVLALIIYVIASSDGFMMIPTTRIVEDVVCHKYYGLQKSTVPIDENLCKEDAIQSKVAFLIAIYSMLAAIVGFFAAFPWGIAADRIGRRPVFAIAVFGASLTTLSAMTVLRFYTIFPVELVWLCSAFVVIGGGSAVLVGIVLSITSDVAAEDVRAMAFMKLHVATLLGNLVSPALSSTMMAKTGPWPVMWIGIACLAIGAISILFVPETLQHKQTDQSDTEDGSSQSASLRSHVRHILHRLRESISILKSPSMILLLFTCLATWPVAQVALYIMIQSVSKRFNVPIWTTGYVEATYGVAQVVHALLILPWISRWLTQESTPKSIRMADDQERDLALARWSFGILILGNIILALAPSLPLYVIGLLVLALGSGFNSLTRSLMSMYVDPEHRSRLFSLVGMVDVIGAMYSPPMLAGLFSLGMKLGGAWMGLPHLGVAGICAIMIGVLLFVRTPKAQADSMPAHEERGEEVSAGIT